MENEEEEWNIVTNGVVLCPSEVHYSISLSELVSWSSRLLGLYGHLTHLQLHPKSMPSPSRSRREEPALFLSFRYFNNN